MTLSDWKDDMDYLPILRRGHKNALVVDGAKAAHAQLRALADLYREDPQEVGSMLTQIAELGDRVERERHLDGLGHAEHFRDWLVDELLDDIGGAEIHLNHRITRRALMQARTLADQAKRIADLATAHLEELTAQTSVLRAAREQECKPLLHHW